jgi:ComF family protein
MPFASGWADRLLSLVYPEVCQICGEAVATPGEGFVCGVCAGDPAAVRFIGPPRCERCGLPYPGAVTGIFVCSNCEPLELAFDAARAAVVATPFILDVIHRYKYRRALWFEPFLVKLLLERAVPDLEGGGWNGIVPVPLHPLRLREREFNQAQRLAWHLSKATGIPLLEGVVERALATRTQALLDRRERAKNVAGVFAVRPGTGLVNQRLIVVDDVLTTGATTSAVSRVLRRAGAARIVAWTLARGL